MATEYIVHHTHGVEEKTSVSLVRHVLCIHKFSTVVTCSQSHLIVVQTLSYLQLFLVLKYTMKQETSTNLHKLYKKQLQMTTSVDGC